MTTVFWLQAGSCGGETMAILSADRPSFSDLLDNYQLELLWQPSLTTSTERSLQQTIDAKRYSGVRISQDLASQIGLADETGILKIYDIDNELELSVTVDQSLQAKNCMLPRSLMQGFLLSDNINIKLVEENK